MTEVAVLATGVANLASVLRCLRRAGARPRVLDDPAEAASAPVACLPGVGSFAAGAQALGPARAAWRARVESGRPTLAICLGMQLLSEGSEEAPGAEGVAAFPGRCARLAGPTVPHMGWTAVGAGAVGAGHAYFAHSYALLEPPPGWECSQSAHGGPFVAALRRGGVLACQFHPELSGAYGAAAVRGWLEGPCQACA